MNIRKQRQNQILSLIENEQIFTQDELIQRLREHGFETTQATISRDIKELKLVKKIGANGKSVYSVNMVETGTPIGNFYDIFAGTVTSVDYAMNTCVIKTHVGMASAACAAIDAMHLEGVVGTLAGDDTIFVLCRDEENTERFCESVKSMINK